MNIATGAFLGNITSLPVAFSRLQQDKLRHPMRPLSFRAQARP